MLPSLSPQSIQDALVQEFEGMPDWDARYKHIIGLGKQLPSFPEAHRTEANKVKGCQSTVWMHADLAKNDAGETVVVYFADSDAMIVRGLIALILRLYSNQPPETILATQPEFIERLDMSAHISMQRRNGLYAMIKQIQMYALAFKMKLESGLA